MLGPFSTCSTRHLTCSLRSLVSYRFKHSKRIPIAKRTHVLFFIYHINYDAIQGFPTLRKAVTIRYFFTCLILPICCWQVIRLSRHSVRLMNERQILHRSKSKVVCRNIFGLWKFHVYAHPCIILYLIIIKFGYNALSLVERACSMRV